MDRFLGERVDVERWELRLAGARDEVSSFSGDA